MHLEMNQKYLCIDNYLQINQINHDLIELMEIIIEGSNLKIVSLTPNEAIISGTIRKITIKED